MNDERLSDSVERILDEPEFKLRINGKERLRSRISDILGAIGIEEIDEFGLAFVSAAQPGLSPGELAARLRKIEDAAGRLWIALSDPLRSADLDETDVDERTINIELADALVLESRVDHIRETGEPAPVFDASLDIRRVIDRIGGLEKIATKAVFQARIAIREGQPRKTLLDTALESFANVYCEFFATQSGPFDLEASDASPFIRLTHAALGRSSHSVASLAKRWEPLRALHRKALDT